MKKSDWLVVTFIILISVITLRDLFKPGLYTSHDGIHQVVRLYYFDQAIRDGQIPPRWAGGLLNGFGYPLFIFSYHLPWLIAEPMHLLGLSIIDSIKMTFLAGFILSGVTMYFFQREIFGRLAAFVGKFFYLFAPYRFSNIFVRAAIGDATTFIFPPLLFLSLYKLREREIVSWQWIILGAVSLAAILLSHAMVFLFFFLSFWMYVVYWSIIRRKRQFVFSSMILALFGLGLSSYYLIPSMVEKSLTKFTEIFKSVYYEATYLSLDKLLYSPWGYGTVDAKEGSMSLQLGIAQWLAVFLAGILLLLCLPRLRSKAKTVIYQEATFYFVLFIFSILLMLPFTSPFWKTVSNIIIIDFTWRILVLSVFIVSVLTGFVISQVKSPWIAFLLISLAIYANRNHLRINQSLDWSMPFYLELEKTTNSYDEYTPKWVRPELLKKGSPKVEFFPKDAKINMYKNTSNYLEFDINAPENGLVRINTIYYPGWVVLVNDQPKMINYKDSGFVEFAVNKGASRVVSHLQETPLRQVSNLLTIATIGIISYLLVKYRQT